MTIRIGFTGTREGMTPLQMRALWCRLAYIATAHDWDPPGSIEVHHGDCLGADAQFHVMATVLGWRTVIHPPLNTSKRAFCKGDEYREPKDYLARDRDIVQETGELLAAPKNRQVIRGGGTVATMGYAAQAQRPCTVFLPDGASMTLSQLVQAAVRA